MEDIAHIRRLGLSMPNPQASQPAGGKEQSTQSANNSDAMLADITTKPRSWSSLELKRTLSPSPAFLEPAKTSKDDTHVAPFPVTPKRPNLPPRGLSLQMPPRDITSSSTANLTTNLLNRVPLSPKLDSAVTYGPTGSVLPRRSRGLDFSRACTNLHHSTLAEQSSPDSSPIISGRAMIIPQRKSLHSGSASSVPDSPGSAANSLWSTFGNMEKPGMSSSAGSINMMDSDSDSDTSDVDVVMGRTEDDDTIHMTPQANKSGFGSGNPFVKGIISSPGIDFRSPFSPATASLMSFQRSRLRHKHSSRKSSSSASVSGHSSMPSPGPVSPPLLKSIESNLSGGYFNKDMTKKDINSRRESLSLGTNDMQISDGAESEDGDANRISPHDALGIPIPVTPTLDERRNVIRRAVTRRGNLLPKPKNFARVRAALQEECSPVDAESMREAEVIRQVRESDNDMESNFFHSQPTTRASSPNLVPVTAGPTGSFDDISDVELSTLEVSQFRRSSSSFTQQAIKNSAGADFWNRFDERTRTPPPPSFMRGNSSSIGDEMSMETPASSTLTLTPQQYAPSSQHPSRSRSSTPQPPLMASEVTRKLGKRRRDDDLDPNVFKRRAVSPGVSLQNSPILPPSPAQRDSGWWAMQAKANREGLNGHTNGHAIGHAAGERVSSCGSNNGSSNLGPPKRIGFQGMNDTNDGLMNMSIE
ncbi:hypothetical protein MMC11_000686 [Xylographa trunciseda]|nr:hypothetical protein [Xylographa trunciseda]